MNRTTIKANQPFSKPLIKPVALFPKQVKIEFRLDDDSNYFAHENDWYKLGGISFSLKPDKNAALVGIRQVAEEWQIVPYLNIDNGRKFDFVNFKLRKYQYYCMTITPVDEVLVYELSDGVNLVSQWVLYFNRWNNFIGFPRKFYAGGDSFPLNDFSLEWNQDIY